MSNSSTLISPDKITKSTFHLDASDLSNLTNDEYLNGHLRMPEWLKAKTGKARQTAQTGKILEDLKIVTVCEEARCPNIGECWGHRTATFMICGERCTRNCAFCNISHGKPLALNDDEPTRVAEAARRMGLRYVVITSVDRDDLRDGGAAHWVATIQAVRNAIPGAKVEVLTPDFKGNIRDIETVAATRPDIYNHNIETVPRLYQTARRGSKYERSLELLRHVKQFDKHIKTKSGLMVGLGETAEEVCEVMDDLYAHQIDFVTIGQYLRPSPHHMDVQKYYHPKEFEELKQYGKKLGFSMIAAGPFVRSSYHAAEDFEAMA
ncbi:MAG: lipoyl synthase [Abditibacteriaceae bacterium]